MKLFDNVMIYAEGHREMLNAFDMSCGRRQAKLAEGLTCGLAVRVLTPLLEVHVHRSGNHNARSGETRAKL